MKQVIYKYINHSVCDSIRYNVYIVRWIWTAISYNNQSKYQISGWQLSTCTARVITSQLQCSLISQIKKVILNTRISHFGKPAKKMAHFSLGNLFLTTGAMARQLHGSDNAEEQQRATLCSFRSLCYSARHVTHATRYSWVDVAMQQLLHNIEKTARVWEVCTSPQKSECWKVYQFAVYD